MPYFLCGDRRWKTFTFRMLRSSKFKNLFEGLFRQFTIDKIYNYDSYELNIILNDHYLYIRNKCLNGKNKINWWSVQEFYFWKINLSYRISEKY